MTTEGTTEQFITAYTQVAEPPTAMLLNTQDSTRIVNLMRSNGNQDVPVPVLFLNDQDGPDRRGAPAKVIDYPKVAADLFDRLTDENYQEREKASKELNKFMYSSPDAYNACMAYIRANGPKETFTPDQRAYADLAIKSVAKSEIGMDYPGKADKLIEYAKSPEKLAERLRVLDVLASADKTLLSSVHGGSGEDKLQTLFALRNEARMLRELQTQLKDIAASGKPGTPQIVLDAMADLLFRIPESVYDDKEMGRVRGSVTRPPQVKEYFNKLLAESPETLLKNAQDGRFRNLDTMVWDYLEAGGDMRQVFALRAMIEKGNNGKPFTGQSGKPINPSNVDHWTMDYFNDGRPNVFGPQLGRMLRGMAGPAGPGMAPNPGGNPNPQPREARPNPERRPVGPEAQPIPQQIPAPKKKP